MLVKDMVMHESEIFHWTLSSLTILYFIQCAHYVHHSYQLCIYDNEQSSRLDEECGVSRKLNLSLNALIPLYFKLCIEQLETSASLTNHTGSSNHVSDNDSSSFQEITSSRTKFAVVVHSVAQIIELAFIFLVSLTLLKISDH